VRFAAKEAFSKALGTGVMGTMSWHDMAVRRDERGNTILQLTGRAKRAAEALGIDRVHLSLTHEREIAAAVVLLETVHRSEA
jgi:holo-[acyl-carrier protein] synthase